MMWLKIILIFVILSLSNCDDADEQVDVEEQTQFFEAVEDTTTLDSTTKRFLSVIC